MTEVCQGYRILLRGNEVGMFWSGIGGTGLLGYIRVCWEGIGGRVVLGGTDVYRCGRSVLRRYRHVLEGYCHVTLV